MKIRAAVLDRMGAEAPYAKSKPLRIAELELDPPGRGEILVRVAAAGLCHSDLSVINGDRPRPMPMALGHEVGRRRRAARGGRERPRKSATTSSWCSCRPAAIACPAPRGGPRCASRARSPTARAPCSLARGDCIATAATVNHHLGVSGFATHCVVSRRSVVKVDPELPLDEAALFGCAVLTGVGAVVNTGADDAGPDRRGDRSRRRRAVLRARRRASGAEKVIAIDLADDKLGPGAADRRHATRSTPATRTWSSR